ncbi:hypothetical protein BCV53_00945 [Parageobacillus thermoglucosidasius]|uniref:Uncharacterized protein n=1 Tax=Parageobacillus thermoglucosidasius TaxID=1426 RepID=A0AAN0YLI6_PARTM|nr:hypothetical protein AOT13_00930 [Parageobacillus thermoglucosidasius]REK56428.1 MAG: hypothetical protein C6P36_09915 [Geobacillus sp.]ANZ28806.1 hypothetical protein BCV53_00945 [Parageobacillus thermoglucosidasius]APM79543.1 hypothetical protein BCV54_00950 [Parageobacillus thermoglucosidasius]KJX68345.1 hypothetical protein WH82_12670 [Parageobacillus thermoglucosidasius]
MIPPYFILFYIIFHSARNSFLLDKTSADSAKKVVVRNDSASSGKRCGKNIACDHRIYDSDLVE